MGPSIPYKVNGVLEPLLPKPVQSTVGQNRDTFWPCAFNLAKAVTGAGMMAIPRAYLQIGSVMGTCMLTGVAALTYFTLAVLIQSSQLTGARTYSQLVDITCGRWVMKVLQLSVWTFCFGFSVVYLVVIRDILLGTPPACSGLLCELFGLDPTGPLANAHVVIAAVALFICAPLLMLRSMDSLAFLNVVGVAAVLLLAAVAAGVGGQALLLGTAHPIPLWPQWGLLGPSKPLQLEALADVLPVIMACYVAHQNLHPLMPLLKPYSPARMCGVVAVALTLSSGVFTTLSVGAALAFGPSLEMNVLNNFSEDDLAPLVGPDVAKVLSWAVRGGYLVSVLGSLLLYMHPLRSCLAEMLWGSPACIHSRVAEANHSIREPAVDDDAACGSGDVDGCMTAEVDRSNCSDVSAFGCSDAKCSVDDIAAAFKPGFDIDIEAAAAAANPSAIDVVPDVLSGNNGYERQQQQLLLPHWQQVEQRWFYVLTYGLLTAMVLVAVLVPSIWSALSAIGDLASTTQAFMIPGCIALVLALKHEPGVDSSKNEVHGEVRHPQQQHVACLQSCDRHHRVGHHNNDEEQEENEDFAGVTVQQGACSSSSIAKADVDALQDADQGCCDSDHHSAVLQQQQQQQQQLGRQHSTLFMTPLHQHPCMLQWISYRRQQSLQGRAKRVGAAAGRLCSAVGRMVHIAMGSFVVLLGLALFVNGVYQRV